MIRTFPAQLHNIIHISVIFQENVQNQVVRPLNVSTQSLQGQTKSVKWDVAHVL